MTLDQIDQSLSEWQARLAVAGTNLLELDDSTAYQRLRGTADRPALKLTGLTLSRISPALAVVDSLWQSQQRLTEIVKQAESLRSSRGRLWMHEGERRQIEFLLAGASVQLPSVEAPFAQRGLLSGAEQARAITPEQLLTQMTQNFTVVKDAVLTLESAWNRLEGSLAAADREAASLQSLADQLGVDARPDFEAVRQEIAALRARVDTDPLGADVDFAADLTTLLARTRVQLGTLKQQQDSLDADLRRAHALLLELDTLQQACQATLAECRTKIEAALLPPPPLPADLSTWLQSVESARRQQQWKPARVGLNRWLEAAEAARKQLSDYCAANKAALERREELRGLLRALQAKAGAQAARGAVADPSLPALAHEAEQLLHGKPTPLERAAALVAEYEWRLLPR